MINSNIKDKLAIIKKARRPERVFLSNLFNSLEIYQSTESKHIFLYKCKSKYLKLYQNIKLDYIVVSPYIFFDIFDETHYNTHKDLIKSFITKKFGDIEIIHQNPENWYYNTCHICLHQHIRIL